MRFIETEFWTTRFLGTAEKARDLVELLVGLEGGRWRPERWAHSEPIRNSFTEESLPEIIRGWIEESPPGSGECYNNLYFLRKKKPRLEVDAFTARLRYPQPNELNVDFEANEFAGPDGVERILDVFRRFAAWSETVYATAHHSSELPRRRVGGTPLDRLEQVHWLNLFGPPYVAMFGRERLLRAPGCRAIEEPDGSILLLTAERPDSPELIESEDRLLELEEYLGGEAFAAKPGYFDGTCRVPEFDLGDLVTSARPEAAADQGGGDESGEVRSWDLGHPDFNELVGTLVPHARDAIERYGSVSPFGAWIGRDGKMTIAAAAVSVDLIESAFRHFAARGEMRAVGLCVQLSLTPPGKRRKTATIAVRLEREGGEALGLFVPCRRVKGAVRLGAPYASEARCSVFADPEETS